MSNNFRSNRKSSQSRSGFNHRNVSRGGGRNRRRFAGKKNNINPQLYVNKAVCAQEKVNIAIKHKFADFNFDERLEASIAKHGYEQPTPIQDQAISYILENKDVAGFAQTGTGKTAAFLLPLIDKILRNDQLGVLIVVPTRELAEQISDEFLSFTRNLPISKTVCVGGLSIRPQISDLKREPHFVIGTPGRLKDLVNRRHLNLSLYSHVVLDEVDRMLDIGFIQDIKFLIEKMPQERQSLFFSATSNKKTNQVMQSFARNPQIITIPARDTSSQVEQDIIKINPGVNKVNVLTELLEEEEFSKVIIFGRTKHGINKLEQILSKRGIRVCSIHGNKSQNARQKSLDQFKRGQAQALLATDVASRGIDIVGVTHVINYDEPDSFDDYIHRIGRTGRAGETGKALTFISRH